MDQLQQLEERRFANMADVMSAVGQGIERRESSDHRLPIEGYDELTVDEVTSRLEGLNPEELQAVRAYEGEHKHRKTLLEALERMLQRIHRG